MQKIESIYTKSLMPLTLNFNFNHALCLLQSQDAVVSWIVEFNYPSMLLSTCFPTGIWHYNHYMTTAMFRQFTLCHFCSQRPHNTQHKKWQFLLWLMLSIKVNKTAITDVQTRIYWLHIYYFLPCLSHLWR